MRVEDKGPLRVHSSPRSAAMLAESLRGQSRMYPEESQQIPDLKILRFLDS